jgi:hypothetical protein
MYFLSTSKHARTLPDIKDNNGFANNTLFGKLEREMEALAHDALANKGELLYCMKEAGNN